MGDRKVSLVRGVDESVYGKRGTVEESMGEDRVQMVFITSSRYKYEVMREVLGVPMESVMVEIEEIQGSKEEIIIDKLRKVSHLATECVVVLVDDTSIHFKGLHGFPGQYAKDFLKMGLQRVVEVAEKVGTECVYSTILGIAHVRDGELETRLFDGAVVGDIGLKDGVSPEGFQDIFMARESESRGMPGIDGVKIGKYRAAEKVREYLIGEGIYNKLLQDE